MNILLLSAYDAASHRYWREQLVAGLPEHHWTVLTQPARHFSWRVRGNSLSWAMNQRELLERPHDRIVATSMVDLAGLKALVPALATVPSIVYWHENQCAYPQQPGRALHLEPLLANLFTALAGDCLLFNSAYNRDSFLQGVDSFLAQMPDETPAGVVQRIRDKSQLLPVPLDDGLARREHVARRKGDPLRLVWNHRWEYDKGPEILLAAVKVLLQRGFAFRLDILGQSFREAPASLLALITLLREQAPQCLGLAGGLPAREAYLQRLCENDVVLSTALHDFQGLAVMEAVACGCTPLVPDRLAYVERFPPACRYAVAADAGREGQQLAARLMQLADETVLPAIDTQDWFWQAQAPRWRAWLDRPEGAGDD